MIEIDLDIVRRLALIAVALGVGFWLAFRHTHDLDDVEDRVRYRIAYGLLMARAFLFTLEGLGWIDRVG